MQTYLSEEQWRSYERDGYLLLGEMLNAEDLSALQSRIDDIMLGRADVPYDRMLMQRDSETGKYEDAGPQSAGFKGATLDYRKIQDLELDPLFMAYLHRPLFREICARVYGVETPIAAFRAMFMNKPARKGTWLPWHQDRWAHLDRDPLITVWTALDPATEANGCVQILAGSHRLGLQNPEHPSGFVTEEQAQKLLATQDAVLLELNAGEAALLHNWLLHASDVNRTDVSRRAFSVCYMDARTQARNGHRYPLIFQTDEREPAQKNSRE
jgi:phytanoyl-CoA hydroxylase